MTLYVADVEHWGEVNRVYTEMLGNHKPARAVVPVKELHYGLAIAAVKMLILSGKLKS